MSAVTEADIDRLSPNDFQPRLQVDDARLHELAQSIRANGVIQPIVVRQIGGRFQIIAGERRWRAARLAGLLRVPIAVRDVAPGQEQTLLQMALIENIQRENLNPIEEALGYRRLAQEFQLKQEDIAKKVGKSRAAIANSMRLLELHQDVRKWLTQGHISVGHAKVLLSLKSHDEQRLIAEKIIRTHCTVRAAEKLVAQHFETRGAPRNGRPGSNGASASPAIRATR